MNKERLLRLADLLEAPTNVGFNLYTWGRFSYKPLASEPCRTVACALGMASMDPEFNKQGLYYLQSKNSILERFILPRYGHLSGLEAGAAFFGISRQQAEYLFLSRNYPEDETCIGPEMARKVASRIRKLVAESNEVEKLKSLAETPSEEAHVAKVKGRPEPAL